MLDGAGGTAGLCLESNVNRSTGRAVFAGGFLSNSVRNLIDYLITTYVPRSSVGGGRNAATRWLPSAWMYAPRLGREADKSKSRAVR